MNREFFPVEDGLTEAEAHKGLLEMAREAGAAVEIIDETPVFTLDSADQEGLKAIVESFGEKTIVRIINSEFIPDALKFGTDKGKIEEYDFRRVTPGSGYDICGVEDEAKKSGLNKSDVLCGLSSSLFIKDGLNLKGLGIPQDRCAVLILDATKLSEIYNSENGDLTDGYRYDDPGNKEDALLGIVRFKEIITEFEIQLGMQKSIDEKIELMKQEVFERIENFDDLKKAPYVALNIIKLLKITAENDTLPIAERRMRELKEISGKLDYKIKIIDFISNMEKRIQAVIPFFMLLPSFLL